MQLAPNNTEIKATITKVFEDDSLNIVILKTPSDLILPAFLWVGKLLTVINKSAANKDLILKEGDIITTEIEVMGDPLKQNYLINKISKIERK